MCVENGRQPAKNVSRTRVGCLDYEKNVRGPHKELWQKTDTLPSFISEMKTPGVYMTIIILSNVYLTYALCNKLKIIHKYNIKHRYNCRYKYPTRLHYDYVCLVLIRLCQRMFKEKKPQKHNPV